MAREIMAFTKGKQYSISVTPKRDRPHLILRVINSTDRRDKAFSLHTTKRKVAKDIEREVYRLLSEAERSGVVPISTKQCSKEWRAEKIVSVKPRTYTRYAGIIEKVLQYLPTEMYAIKSGHLKRYKSLLVQEGKRNGRSSWS